MGRGCDGKQIGDQVLLRHTTQQEHVALQLQDVEEIEAGRHKGRGPSGSRPGGVHRVPDGLHLGGQTFRFKHEALWRSHVLGLGRQGQLPQIVQPRKVATTQPQLRQPFTVVRVTLEHQIHGLAKGRLSGRLQLRQRGKWGVSRWGGVIHDGMSFIANGASKEPALAYGVIVGARRG